MDKQYQDLEKLKKTVWALQQNLNITEIQNQLNEFQQNLESDVTNHIENLTGQLNAFQEEIQTGVQADFENLETALGGQVSNFQSEVTTALSLQDSEIIQFKDEVNTKIEKIASAGTTGAMVDASNIETTKWIEKLLTGNEGYGDKVVDKMLFSTGYIKFASGLIIQWGNDFEDVHKTDYIDASVAFPTPFSSATSYAVGSTPRRSSLTPYRDARFSIRNLTSTGFGYMWYGQSNSNDKWQFQWIAVGF